jgi:hypothetical protein
LCGFANQIRSAGWVKSISTFFSGTSAVVQGKHQYDRETQDLTVIATAPTPGIDSRKKQNKKTIEIHDVRTQ